MTAQNENYDYSPLEIEAEKIENDERRLLWWRLSSGLELVYRVIWASVFGLAVYQNNNQCDDLHLVRFGEVIFVMMILLIPFMSFEFGASLVSKSERTLRWKKYFYWIVLFSELIDAALLIGSEVYYNEPEALSDGCKAFHAIYKEYILISSIVIAISGFLIAYFWRNNMFEEQDNESSEVLFTK